MDRKCRPLTSRRTRGELFCNGNVCVRLTTITPEAALPGNRPKEMASGIYLNAVYTIYYKTEYFLNDVTAFFQKSTG